MIKKHSALEVGRYLEWWASTAVETQILLDEDFEARHRNFGIFRQQIARFEAEVELGISIQKRTGLEIAVTPLNLGYRISRGYTQHADARVTITVEQVALGSGAME